jgi:CotH kinase protein/Lamin Tail Domain/Chitobiase/beta-hexosaminidase C-terminal domain
MGGLLPLAGAAEPPVIRGDSVAVLSDGSVTFQFTADPGEVREFVVQSSAILAAADGWKFEGDAAITEPVPGLFEARVPPGSPRRQTFYRLLSVPPVPGALVINEVMGNNTASIPDSGGAFWDWIEIYNGGETAINLLDYGLTDDPLRPHRWQFPDRTLQPDSYLVVYASGLDRIGPGDELHASFRLDASGETLELTAPDKRLVSRLDVPALSGNESLGRPPTGDESWVVYSGNAVTPGAENAAVSTGPLIPAPEFPPGEQFLPAGAELGLVLRTSVTGGVIRYTTNGSPVTPASPEYTGPVPLNRTTVVRARTYSGTKTGSESMRTYFFGVDHDLPVVSLAAPSSNFGFDGYLFGMGSSVVGAGGQVLQSYPYSGSNAWKDREIEVAFEFFETDRRSVVRQRLGLSVYGGWGSRGYPQKSLALFARQKYGDGNINHQIFPDRPMERFESLVLRNSGNDNQSTHQTAVRAPITQFGPVTSYGSYFVNGSFTLMRDGMMQRLIAETGLDTQAYRPAVIYINAEYWGLYNLREKINEHYVIGNHEVPKGGLDLIEGYGSVIAGDNKVYNAMRTFIAGRDMKLAANFRQVEEQYLEIDNFIDYHLAVIYFQNFDIGNIKCWRPRIPNGRFRWIVYDQDYGFNLWDPAIYVPAMARDYGDYDNMFRFYTAGTGTGTGWPNEGGRTLLLRRLLLNDTFRKRFVQRCADLLNGPFLESRVEQIIRSMSGVIRPEIPRHLERWSFSELAKRGYGVPYKTEYAPFTAATWEGNLGVLIDFARTRPSKLRADCLSHFKLQKGIGHLEVTVDPPAAGRAILNTSTALSSPWVGAFFRDYPVTLTALPEPGFRITGWTGPAGTVDTVMWETEVPTGTNRVTVHFESYVPAPPANPPLVVTEFQYHPAPAPDSGDWIELHNPGVEAVITTGWILRDSSGDNVYVLPESSVPAGGYLVLCQDSLKFRRTFPAAPRALGPFQFGLGNGGDTLRLHAPDGTLMLSLNYTDEAPWPSGADGTGHTLQLKDSKAYAADPGAWTVSPALLGTPGVANP